MIYSILDFGSFTVSLEVNKCPSGHLSARIEKNMVIYIKYKNKTSRFI